MTRIIEPKAALTCAAVSTGMMFATNYDIPLNEFVMNTVGRAAASAAIGGWYLTNAVIRPARKIQDTATLAALTLVGVPAAWCAAEYAGFKTSGLPNAEGMVALDYLVTAAMAWKIGQHEYRPHPRLTLLSDYMRCET